MMQDCKRCSKLLWNVKKSMNYYFSDATKKPGVTKRVFSGIQPTGVPHIGNYLGALQHWVQLQHQFESVLYCIVDLHAFTTSQQPGTMRDRVVEMASCLLACGVDPKRSILFQQSRVPHHTDLSWILSCLTSMPRIQHLPQWKEKSDQLKEADRPLGLFTYPVLQSADILLYKATDVPVGDDQKQHIELTRHLCKKFNKNYGFLFPTPKSITGDFPRIKSLRNPSVKMSKSEVNTKSRIELTDTKDSIQFKLQKALTDFTSHISYDPEHRPGVSNLVDIHAALVGKTPEEVVKECEGVNITEYKGILTDVIDEKIAPIRKEIGWLLGEVGYVEAVLASGAKRATEIAEETYREVREMVGFR